MKDAYDVFEVHIAALLQSKFNIADARTKLKIYFSLRDIMTIGKIDHSIAQWINHTKVYEIPVEKRGGV